MDNNKIENQPRWYFAGLSSTVAVCLLHPLDSLKVQLQAQKNQEKGLVKMGKEALKRGGLRGIFVGLDSNILVHMTSATARLGFYDVYKTNYCIEGTLTLIDNVIASSIGGCLGGVIGNPTEVIKIRMQNDIMLPNEMKRNYKNVVDGLGKVIKQEGFTSLFRGVGMTCMRNSLATFGQAAGYDECKYQLLKNEAFKDDVRTHILSGFGSGMALLSFAIPFDVIKTRLTIESKNKYNGVIPCIKEIASCGLRGFYKGSVPLIIRIMPQNILLFVMKEQLTEHFGIEE